MTRFLRHLGRPLGELARGLQWTLLFALSAAIVVVLEVLRLPAALLIGPMAAGALIGAREGTIRVPAYVFYTAQAVIGCMVGRTLPFSIVGEMLRAWPLFLTGVVSVIAAAAFLGWSLARWRVLPGTTAVWGSSPGAASAMIVMADAFGADLRLVAFMQYLRMACVALAASLVARFWVGEPVQAAAPVWFPPVAWLPFAETLALAVLGAAVATWLRVRAGPFLLPLVIGTVLQNLGWLSIELPPWFLAISYAIVGWTAGLRFTRPILVHAARSFPRVMAAILALIGLCGLLAGALVLAGVDPLTAYLATSPGGADTVAIIAASSHVDLPFVMAMQTTRFAAVLLTGPGLARFIARRTGTTEEAAS